MEPKVTGEAANRPPRIQRNASRVLSARARDVLKSLWASVALQVALFGSGILVARHLGPAGRGDLAVALLLPGVAAQAVAFGIPSAVTYYVAKAPGAWRSVIVPLKRVIGGQCALASLLSVILVILFLRSKGHAAMAAGVIGIGTGPIFVAQYYGLATLQGTGDFKWWNILRVAPSVTYTAGLVACMTFDVTMVTIALVWLTSQALMLLILVHRLRIAGGASHDTTERATPSIRDTVRYGVVGFLAQVSPVETFRIDSLVVALVFPSATVGYYAVAIGLSNAPRFIADGIVSVAYPHLSTATLEAGFKSAQRYLLAAAALCGGATVAIASASPWLIPIIFGEEFRPATSIAVILLAAVFLVSVRRVGSDCLRALGQPGRATLVEIATLLALAVALALFARTGNGKGVAAALAVSSATGLAMIIALLWRVRSRNPTIEPLG